MHSHETVMAFPLAPLLELEMLGQHVIFAGLKFTQFSTFSCEPV